MPTIHPKQPASKRFALSEDWLAILIAFILILLSAIGLIGQGGIRIVF